MDRDLDKELREAVREVMNVENPTNSQIGAVQMVLWHKAQLARASFDARVIAIKRRS